MKIQDSPQPSGQRPAGVASTKQGQDVSEARKSDNTPAAAGPDVQLSARAEEFRRLRAKLDALPAGANADRIAELKELVESGKFAVDAEKIVKALADDPITRRALGLDEVS